MLGILALNPVWRSTLVAPLYMGMFGEKYVP
jgi:hypothetical protein